MCPSENALEVRASGVRSESFALGKRFAVANLTTSLSPRAKLRPRMLVTSRRLFRHPRSKSSPAKISYFLAAEPAWKQANCRLSHPLSLRRRKASLIVDRVQQGEPSLFGSSSWPNVNVVPSRFWFPLGLPCLQVDLIAKRKKGDLVPYSGDVFPTEAHKAPSCPLVKPKMDLYCSGFSLSETSQH